MAAEHARTEGGVQIAVLENADRPRRGWIPLRKERDFSFSAEPVRRSTLADWEEVIQDAMVVGAAVEYADYTVRRPSGSWTRRLSIEIPVYEPERWNDPAVAGSLRSALCLLTGDAWRFSFRKTSVPRDELRQKYMPLAGSTAACMPFSSGLDSLAVSHLEKDRASGRLLLVRVQQGIHADQDAEAPFVGVPYSISYGKRRRETSGRTRGFRFGLISGLAAYLAEAPEILFPESGQGAIGPAIAMVGTTYPDYRNHPLFTVLMQRFLKALLHWSVRYEFPRLWSTKGGTLSEFVRRPGAPQWTTTRSCWRDSRWSSVRGKRRQCGICAACMLRRLSVHAAELREDPEAYVVVDMDAASLKAAVDPSFGKVNSAFRNYAIAGVLHMKNMADLVLNEQRGIVAGHAALLSRALDAEVHETEVQLLTLFEKHREEWRAYLNSLDKTSFVRSWSAVG